MSFVPMSRYDNDTLSNRRFSAQLRTSLEALRLPQILLVLLERLLQLLLDIDNILTNSLTRQVFRSAPFLEVVARKTHFVSLIGSINR
jgi:hypothetical protein